MQDPKFRKMIGELVLKKEETARKRAEMLLSQGTVVAPNEQCNFVKVSRVVKKTKTTNGKVVINGYVLMQKLGQGAFGQVSECYQAQHIILTL